MVWNFPRGNHSKKSVGDFDFVEFLITVMVFWFSLIFPWFYCWFFDDLFDFSEKIYVIYLFVVISLVMFDTFVGNHFKPFRKWICFFVDHLVITMSLILNFGLVASVIQYGSLYSRVTIPSYKTELRVTSKRHLLGFHILYWSFKLPT